MKNMRCHKHTISLSNRKLLNICVSISAEYVIAYQVPAEVCEVTNFNTDKSDVETARLNTQIVLLQ